MPFALALHNVKAILIQLYVWYAYVLEAVENRGVSQCSLDSFPNSKKAFVVVGAGAELDHRRRADRQAQLSALLQVARPGHPHLHFGVVGGDALHRGQHHRADRDAAV
jgi:hypothetical protein